MVFSPRPAIVSNRSFFQTQQRTAKASGNRFSYAVSTDGIEVHQPQADCNSDTAVSDEYHLEPILVLPRTQAAIRDDMPGGPLTPISEIKTENGSSLSLSMRRGKELPALNLTLHQESRLSNEDLNSGGSQETLINSPPSLSTDGYDTIKVIGHDSEGPCTLVRSRSDNQLRVVKSVRHPILAYGKPIEARILQDAFPERHDNIIRLHAYDSIEKLDLVQYCFEYCAGGDLHNLVRAYDLHNARLPELFIWKVFLKLSSALEFLHRGFDPKTTDRPGIVHRDIKPPNIFLRCSQQNTVYPDAVIADFGSASLDFATYEPAGTYLWQPPEIPRKSPKGDVWGLGATVHFMVHFEAPMLDLPKDWTPTDANYDVWEMKPEVRQPIRETPGMYSQELIDMMFVALEFDHNKRASSGRLLTVLEDVIEKQYPHNADKITNAQPLELWAFDHLVSRTSSSGAVGNDRMGEGRKQYYQMMRRLRKSNPTSSATSIGPTF